MPVSPPSIRIFVSYSLETAEVYLFLGSRHFRASDYSTGRYDPHARSLR